MWNTGETTSNIQVFTPGQYIVQVLNKCGSSIDTVSFIYDSICECEIYIPNSFTPNNDNLNDLFTVVSNCDFKEFSLEVYNRWGQKIFKSEADKLKWDGRYLGEIVENGQYLVVFSGIQKGNERVNYKSIVIVVR